MIRHVVIKTLACLGLSILLPLAVVYVYGGFGANASPAGAEYAGRLLAPFATGLFLAAIITGLWFVFRDCGVAWLKFGLIWIIVAAPITLAMLTSLEPARTAQDQFFGISRIVGQAPESDVTVVIRGFSKTSCLENSAQYLKGLQKSCPACTSTNFSCVAAAILPLSIAQALAGKPIASNYAHNRILLMIFAADPADTRVICEQTAQRIKGTCVAAVDP